MKLQKGHNITKEDHKRSQSDFCVLFKSSTLKPHTQNYNKKISFDVRDHFFFCFIKDVS